MNSKTFDDVTVALAKGMSRRRAIVGLGGAALAGLGFSRSGGAQHRLLGQPEPAATPEARSRPVFEPIFVGPGVAPVAIDETPEDDIFATPAADDIFPTPAATEPDASPESTPQDGIELGPEESVCGNINDSQHVEMYDGTMEVTREFVNRHQASVGNLRWNSNLHRRYQNDGNVNGVHWCSGTLIDDDLFLTAAHCFKREPGIWVVPRVNGTNQAISRGEIATNMKVVFNYQFDPEGVLKQEVSIPVIGLVEDFVDGRDYAIVQLAEPPGAPFVPARVATTDAPLGSTICIISHPGGFYKRVEAGAASQYVEERLYYNDIDTDGGSSGAGILSNPAGSIVGIHTNGGCGVIASGNNNGLRIEALLPVSQTLRRLATSAST